MPAKSIGIVTGLLISVTLEVLAQPLPNIQSPEKLKLSNEVLVQPLPSARSTEDLKRANSESFFLNEVRLEGSTVFTPEQVHSAVAQYLDKQIPVDDLPAIITTLQSRLTQMYVQAGYVTSVVIFPVEENQNIESGVIIYRAVEKELEKLEIRGLTHLQESYVRSRLLSYASPPLNAYKLEEGLQLLREDPLFSNISSTLIPGSQPNTNQWSVTVEEAPLWRIEGEGSNDESPFVGSWGGRISIENQDVFGFGDRIAVEYKKTEGLDRFLVTSRVPVNSRNGAVQLSYQLTDTQIVADDFEEIGIRNDSQTVSFSFLQPLIENLNHTFQVGFTVEYRESQSYILDDIPFSFDPGVKDGYTQLGVFRASQTYRARSQDSVFLVNSQFNVGFSNVDADPNFLSWQGQLQWLQKLGEDTQLFVRLSGQLSPNVLPTLEQCAIGGLNGNLFIFGNTVRGYSTNVRSGDNCFAVSAELRFNLLEDETWGTLELVTFFDFGTVWDNEGSVFAPNTLISTGLGLRWRIRDRVSVRFDYGFPLVSVNDQPLEEQRENFSFLLGWNF